MFRPFFVLYLVLLSARLAVSEPPNTPIPPEVAFRDEVALRNEVARLVEQLDSDQFDVRQKAMDALVALTAHQELRPRLAVVFQQLKVRSDISFEVRKQIGVLCQKLPQVSAKPVEDVAPEEIARLVTDLEDESYSVRIGAAERLKWLLNNPRWGLPVMKILKQRIDDTSLSVDSLHWIEPIYKRARGSWLLNEAPRDGLPKVTKPQIQQWIDALAESPSDPPTTEDLRRMKRAERELFDALAHDADVPFIQGALEARLARDDDDLIAKQRLTKLLELTRPAMVAEYWESRHHLGVQHLLVGVPSQSLGAIRPSHFDAIDDSTAHCVSGTNLSEGDYPVGVAIAHPNRPGAVFHLVNLSTPRRRMAYEYYLKKPESVRLQELTRRTSARLLRRKQPSAENEIAMLMTLDAVEVSRFASDLFLTVKDRPLQHNPLSRLPQLIGKPSCHGLLCKYLAHEGTKEAIPGLEKGLETEQFLASSLESPYEFAWIAALSIASRDPWPEVDTWLAKRLDRKERLIKGRADSPQLGATAAAILLSRHQQKPFDMGLFPVSEVFFTRIQLIGYRYSDSEPAEAIQEWWQAKQNEPKPTAETSL